MPASFSFNPSDTPFILSFNSVPFALWRSALLRLLYSLVRFDNWARIWVSDPVFSLSIFNELRTTFSHDPAEAEAFFCSAVVLAIAAAYSSSDIIPVSSISLYFFFSALRAATSFLYATRLARASS